MLKGKTDEYLKKLKSYRLKELKKVSMLIAEQFLSLNMKLNI